MKTSASKEKLMFAHHHMITLVQAIARGGSSCCPPLRGLRKKNKP